MSKRKPPPDLTRLRSILSYDEVTGIFSRNGEILTPPLSRGYAVVYFDGVQYMAHRLAWYFVHGYWPFIVDHINGIKSDNRLSNLRVLTNSENIRAGWGNRECGRIRGVAKHTYLDKWRAYISVEGRRFELGLFPTRKEAEVARRSAEFKYGTSLERIDAAREIMIPSTCFFM